MTKVKITSHTYVCEFSDMAVKRVDLSKSIFSILNEMERNIREGA